MSYRMGELYELVHALQNTHTHSVKRTDKANINATSSYEPVLNTSRRYHRGYAKSALSVSSTVKSTCSLQIGQGNTSNINATYLYVLAY
jgi:hypothetical protein